MKTKERVPPDNVGTGGVKPRRKNPPKEPGFYMDLREASGRSGLSRDTLLAQVDERALPPLKRIGGKLYFESRAFLEKLPDIGNQLCPTKIRSAKQLADDLTGHSRRAR